MPFKTPPFSVADLPEVPINLTVEEQRQGRALKLSWILPSANKTLPGIVIFVLEQRNSTSQKPAWNENTPWKTAFMVSRVKLKKICSLLKQIMFPCYFRIQKNQTDLIFLRGNN